MTNKYTHLFYCFIKKPLYLCWKQQSNMGIKLTNRWHFIVLVLGVIISACVLYGTDSYLSIYEFTGNSIQNFLIMAIAFIFVSYVIGTYVAIMLLPIVFSLVVVWVLLPKRIKNKSNKLDGKIR